MRMNGCRWNRLTSVYDYVTADRSSRMKNEVFRAILPAQIQKNIFIHLFYSIFIQVLKTILVFKTMCFTLDPLKIGDCIKWLQFLNN